MARIHALSMVLLAWALACACAACRASVARSQTAAVVATAHVAANTVRPPAAPDPNAHTPTAQPSSAAEPAPLPFWASPEGLAPDPQRPGFTVAGDAFKGNPRARVVVVEFSNFQCPSCRQHTQTVQPLLDREFVDTGQVLWVFKHLPSPGLPQSTAAALAAECAGAQGRFWPMHDLLFEAESQWAVDRPEEAFLRQAAQLGLDLGQFSACQDSPFAREHVAADLHDAVGVAESTPTFVVLLEGRGSILEGSGPAELFASILRTALKQAHADRAP